MKFEWNRKASTIAAYTFIVLALAILFYQLVASYSSFIAWLEKLLHPLLPIFYGFALAYLLNPIMLWIETTLSRAAPYMKMRKKYRRTLSLVLTYLLTAAVLAVFLIIVLPQVGQSVTTMVMQIQVYVASTQRFVINLFESIPNGLVPQNYIDQISAMLGRTVSGFISMVGNSMPAMLGALFNVGAVVINCAVGIIVSIYLLFSKEIFIGQLRKTLCAFLPRKKYLRICQVGHTTDLMFGRFITGKIIDSIIIGILCFVGLSVIRMPNTVLVSFIVGVTNVIPYFGPFLGAIPSFFLIAIFSPMKGLIFLVFVLVLQQLDGNVIGPMILGDSTGLSAFWVVTSILFFGGAFGIFGMVIAVPTFGVLYWIIKEKILAALDEKGLPPDTASYMSSEGDASTADVGKQVK